MTSDVGEITTTRWQDVDPALARDLVDTRLQLHHAAQLATAIGISYVPKRADDSHTNLEWLRAREALASRFVDTPTPFRVAMRPSPFALLLLDASNEIVTELSLSGRTIEDARRWLQSVLPSVGADPEKLTLKRHYVIPTHPVHDGAPFDASHERAFRELGSWYDNAASVLTELADVTPSASEVRCWPHHFDIATLIEVVPARDGQYAHTVGVGLEPGDNYYAEPYFYVNMYPSPPESRVSAPLSGSGMWHTHEWVGAVLPGSHLLTTSQRLQVESFLGSAVRICTELVGGGGGRQEKMMSS
jgi:hypothetical protein